MLSCYKNLRNAEYNAIMNIKFISQIDSISDILIVRAQDYKSELIGILLKNGLQRN